MLGPCERLPRHPFGASLGEKRYSRKRGPQGTPKLEIVDSPELGLLFILMEKSKTSAGLMNRIFVGDNSLAKSSLNCLL